MERKNLTSPGSHRGQRTTGVLLASGVAIALSLPANALTFSTDRAAFNSNDSLDWSSLGKIFAPPIDASDFLPFSFSATSQKGLGLNVNIPLPPVGSGITPPFVFQTLPPPQGIPTNFAFGDFVLFSGLLPGRFPAPGNPGPLTIIFDKPVLAAGTQIAVDDTLSFTGFISAFDKDDNLLGEFAAPGTSSLALDNTALFLGVRSDTANISKLVFQTSVPGRAIGINTLSLDRASVPESSIPAWGWLFGAIGVGLMLRVQRQSPNSD